MADELQPDALPDVLGVGIAQAVVAADRPDERSVPFDDGIPRLLVAFSGTYYQVGDAPGIAHLVVSFQVCRRDQALVLMHSKRLVPQVITRWTGIRFQGH